MDHHYIDEHDLASLYLRDDLDPREREQFEGHFARCPQCMDRIALAEIFMRRPDRPPAVMPAAAPAITQAKAAASRGFAVRLADMQPWRLWAALAMASVLLVGLPTAFFAGLLHGGGVRLEAVPARRGLIGASAAMIMPLLPGVNRISVASSTVLMMEPKATTANSKYQVRLLNSEGGLAWERELQAGGPIAVIVPAGALRPGTYSLRLISLSPDGRKTQLDDFTISAGAS